VSFGSYTKLMVVLFILRKVFVTIRGGKGKR
jgi:hypothetical protein